MPAVRRVGARPIVAVTPGRPLSDHVCGGHLPSKACHDPAGSTRSASMPTGRVGEADDLSLVAHPGDLGGLARDLGAPSGPVWHRHAWRPEPPADSRDDTARDSGLARPRPRRALPPALAGRNRAGASQAHEADGGVARQHRTRRAEGMDGVRPRLQPGASGHVPISQAPTPWRGADQRAGCAAMARHATHRHPMRRVARQRHPTASRRAAHQETTAQELPVHDHTPASTASTVGPPRARANFMPFGVQPNLMPFGQELLSDQKSLLING